MSFGKRGIIPSANISTLRSRSKQQFIQTSSTELKSNAGFGLKLSTLWPKGERLSGIVYPLSCLALGIVLGGGIGATLAPQLLLAADDAGVYQFIHMNEATMRGRAVQRPRAALPQLSFRRARGRWGLMQARLPPDRYLIGRHHVAGSHALAVAKPEPEIGPERGRDTARFGSPLEAIFHDKTLRAGDTVMMSMGAVVFRGGDRLPYSAADFADFRESRLLTKKERQQIDADLGLTMRAEAMRNFGGKVAAAPAAPTLAKTAGMRAFFPVTQTR
jgi:hypothetical protein